MTSPVPHDIAVSPAPPTVVKVKPAKKNDSFLLFLLKLGIFVFILRSFLFAPFSIPSESMLPRLLVGDYLIVTKWNYGYSRHSFPFSLPLIAGPKRLFERLPVRGDVVVFKAPPGNSVDYIKRVIGLPGDTIQLRDGVVWLNGQAIPKTRIADFVEPVSPNSRCLDPMFTKAGTDGGGEVCDYPRYRETLPNGRSYDVLDLGSTTADDTPVFTVPAGHLFMMGDDRDRSADSRFATDAGGIGFVPVENLVGKATLSVFSTDGNAAWFNPVSWFTAARWHRIGQGF